LQAIAELANGPDIAGSEVRNDIMAGLRTLHIARHGRRGRHFLYSALLKAASSRSDASSTIRWIWRGICHSWQQRKRDNSNASLRPDYLRGSERFLYRHMRT
jgi:hypothetical protein